MLATTDGKIIGTVVDAEGSAAAMKRRLLLAQSIGLVEGYGMITMGASQNAAF
jgi:hypothetical protein